GGELLLAGREIGSEGALRVGLVNEVVADAELLTRVRELAQQLCANSAESIRASKALLAKVLSSDLDEALDYACVLNARSRSSPDCIEGVAAFLEKRQPRWS